MLSGAMSSALAIVGTAVFKIVVSNDSMKKDTATSHGRTRVADSLGTATRVLILPALVGIIVWTASYSPSMAAILRSVILCFIQGLRCGLASCGIHMCLVSCRIILKAKVVL